MLKAVTFDLWDTIVVDDSDEIERKKRGLLTKSEERKKLMMDEITKHHPEFSKTKVAEAFKHANDTFNVWWKQKHVTPTVSERLMYAYDFLKIAPTPDFSKVVEKIETMELEIMPVLAEGIGEALKELSKSFKLAIISDAIHTPGKGLREILRKYDLLNYFQVFIFSDEAGNSKPAAKVFELAKKSLGVEFSEIAHIGDRESNDVAGPNSMNMKSILYTGIIDRGSANTKATVICKHHKDLNKLVRSL